MKTGLTNPPQVNLEIFRCPRTNLAKVSFRQLIGPDIKADTVYIENLSADFPTTLFIPYDTLSAVNLPLNPDATSTTFTFDFKDGSTQTITFNYITTEWDAFSSWCDNLKLFSTVSVSAHNFNDVQISNDSIHDPPVTNAAIFK